MPSSWRDADLVKEMTLPLFCVSIYASLGGATYGWDANYWSGLLGETTFINDFGVLDKSTGSYVLPSSWQSAGSGAPTAATALGCVVAGLVGDRFGRIKSFYLASALSIIGVIIQSTANNYWQLVVGRMINAVSMGIVCNVVPNYQAECAPAKIRGSMVNTYQVWLLIGATFAVTCNWGLHARTDQWAYRVVIILQIVVPALMFLGAFILPESPRWLVKKGRNEEAGKVLRLLRRGTPVDVVDEEVRLLVAAEQEQEKHHRAVSWIDCFRGTNLRRTAIAAGVQCLQQAQGNSFIMNYSITFLQQIGIGNEYKILVLLIFVNMASSVFAFYFSDKIGRRPLLLGGAVILCICMYTVAGITGYDDGNKQALNGALAALFVWQFVQAICWGSCVWIVTSEVATLQLREKTITIATFAGFCVGVIVTFVSPYLQDSPGNLQGRIGFVYGSFSFVSAVWIAFMLPEMKGKSLEELDEIFEKGVSVWKFGSYVGDSYGARLTQVEAAAAVDVLEGMKPGEPENGSEESVGGSIDKGPHGKAVEL